ncbi:hypothetical protein SAMN04487936_104227 [Halobacillus dabanensis]|uniref:Uncharacterized protein n=1 Tax=Halobacillus dabanensis TaxID=240302 RepID=A0A1I3U9C7_HALDA|nr:hypothetical protein SAMN04487936_104227 [Halobacillus dabanensis]
MVGLDLPKSCFPFAKRSPALETDRYGFYAQEGPLVTVIGRV